jgi:hypothetical protein
MKAKLNIIKLLIISFLAISLGLSSMAFIPANGLFDDPVPTKTPKNAEKAAQQEQRLANAFKREQDALAKQQTHLDKINELTTKAQTLIDKARANGKDVATLESALATFKSQMTQAQAKHDTAAGILSTHNGFDANGAVTDRTTARETVMSARQSLRDTHITLRQAIVDFRQVVRTWRAANHPNKTPEPASQGSGA